jgi:hypothetical protein
MTINYTTLLGLAQPVTGTEANTWGTVVNDEITALIEEAIAGGETIDVTSGNVTLTDTDGVANQARNAILLITGTPGTTRNVVAPSQSKAYIVVNGSNGSVVIKGSATTGATIAAGARAIVAWNGSDFVEVGSPGDVDGPASATDNAVARFDGTTGKIIQNSAVTIADDGTTIISVNSASNALRITQTGAGNALVVEDSANPDSTPVVVDAEGRIVQGHTSVLSIAGNTSTIQQHGLASQSSTITSVRWQSANAAGPQYTFGKSRSGTVGSYSVLSSGDVTGTINFAGDDGSALVVGASISSAVDGTPGTGDMPGRLVFSTTADGASSPTERMRIDSAGRVGIGSTSLTGYNLRIGSNITGATSAYGVFQTGQIQSDVTTNAVYFRTSAATAATAFTAASIRHFESTQGTIGAGSTVTNQTGFWADASLTGATNNYGFYSNIASGTGRWNFYANGTAQNYFNGTTLIGTLTNTNSSTVVSGGTISQTVGGTQYLVVDQSDIGTAPNEIPLNQYLGALAYEDTETPALNIGTGITTGTGTICRANGGLMGGIYQMTILIDLTGLNSGGTAGDIIGVNGTALPCYIAQLPAMTVLGGRMTCLETPAGGDTDIDLYSATEGTGVEDQAITALTETEIINAGTQSRGTVTYFSADPAANAYFYLVGQSTSNATYTAGRFLIEIFGVQ